MEVRRSVLERREENVNQLVQKAFGAAQTGNYLVVQEQLQAAQDLDPSNKNVQQLTEKFQKVVASVPSAMGQEESATLTRKALLAYANNDMKASVATLRQAYYKDPRNERLLSLLNKIEAEATMKRPNRPRAPSSFLRSIKRCSMRVKPSWKAAMTWPSKNARTS